jgi:hypothetical protein
MEMFFKNFVDYKLNTKCFQFTSDFEDSEMCKKLIFLELQRIILKTMISELIFKSF